MNYIVKQSLNLGEKLERMYEDAHYDVADSECEAISAAMEIKSAKAPPKVPKIFLSNNCAFNCAYCGCRCSHDKERYCFEPKEMARLAVDAAIKTRQGIFLTSAIYKNSNYTQELILETVRSIRQDCHYLGYLHAKVMPGADPLLIHQTGLFANRLSVNIEVAKSEGYKRIAKQKSRENILSPMGQISQFIKEAKRERKTQFAISQTTQMMAGSTNEDDRTILTLSHALYKKYRLKRVYYTPYHYIDPAEGYELPEVRTPQWRMRRLYQADRLMQVYGFKPEDITPSAYTFLEEDLDPKAAWALRNLHRFPLEVNTADYESLIRVPGIGTTYAQRIIQARKICGLSFETLSKMKIPLIKAGHFITCGGKYHGELADDIIKMRVLLADPQRE